MLGPVARFVKKWTCVRFRFDGVEGEDFYDTSLSYVTGKGKEKLKIGYFECTNEGCWMYMRFAGGAKKALKVVYDNGKCLIMYLCRASSIFKFRQIFAMCDTTAPSDSAMEVLR